MHTWQPQIISTHLATKLYLANSCQIPCILIQESEKVSSGVRSMNQLHEEGAGCELAKVAETEGDGKNVKPRPT